MGLIKDIALNNGIILKYHRIYSINKRTNIGNLIEIHSYINKEQRLKEKDYQILQTKSIFDKEHLTTEDREALDKGINVLVEADFIELPYDADMTIEGAYTYLKTTEKFKDAQDDIEV